MSRFKLCPNCGKKNLPSSIQCVVPNCEEDLSSVPISDDEMLIRNDVETTYTRLDNEPKMVKICDCGFHNLVISVKCEKCGEEISDIIPTPETEVTEKGREKVVYKLNSLDGKYEFLINKPKVIIGREYEMSEYLTKKVFVSRLHAELINENNCLFITNLNATNSTYVNNIKVTEEKTKLNNGDELGLGGFNVNGEREESAAYFYVGIE